MSVAVAEIPDLTNIAVVSPEQQIVDNLQEKHDFLFKRANDLHAGMTAVPETIDDEEAARKAADFAKQIGYGVKDLNTTRTAEKAPHDSAAAAVQNLFMKPINVLKKDKETVEDRLQVWQEKEADRKRKIAEEEARKKREEAERLRKEEEAKAAAAREEAERVAREAREKADAQRRETEERQRQAEALEREAKERAAAAERLRQEAEQARARAEEDRRKAIEEAAEAGRKRDAAVKAAKEAEETAERQRKAAEADRLKAERERQAAAEEQARLERQRLEQEERNAARIKLAEEAGAKKIEKADARVVQASERETAAIVKETRVIEAKPYEFGQVRGDYGATASLRTDWDFQITNMAALRGDILKLAQHFDQAALERAIRSFVDADGRDLAGVIIFEDVNTVVR
ncbi:MAG TPA: hypothetical protein VM659_28780 [Dongiaceae bacterium]|nr:hypothetical protein [Dongiaceae bacterium]